MPENLRRHLRRTARFPAHLVFPWGTLDGTIENIGEGGTFFVTDTLEGKVEEGERLEVRFESDNGPATLPGLVLRVERYFHAGSLFRTFAVKFDAPYRRPARGR